MDEPSVRAVGWARSLPMGGEVKAARDWARGHLDALGWTTTVPETADAVLLTVSELVTNAHKHARSNAQLTLSLEDNSLHISVHDASAVLPARRSPGTEATGGRGMFLVDALADEWESRPCPHGKSVTACFHGPQTAEEPEAEAER
ncbi:ATP-binding protein [Streptomyces prasinus]|uniref:ATP-binding protein n=1 Tax=Streptomyces prasinus TaxID=67345 RepID=UPI00380CD421